MLGAEAREANKAWLMQQVNHVLEPLMLAIVREKPTDTVSKKQARIPRTSTRSLFGWLRINLFGLIWWQIKYMVEYMEREFGERALNGDKSQAAILHAKIAELERKLEH